MGARSQRVAAPFRNALLIALLALTPGCGRAQTQEAIVITKLERLAANGNAEAIYHLGMIYHVGLGVQRDKVKALADFRKAAELGDPLGSYKLGCYYDGQGEGLIEGDPGLALKYKMVAAKAGYALAQQDVAAHYARRGDMAEAKVWLERAAKQGWSDALSGYATVHNGKNGIPRDPVIVDAYFRLFLKRTDGGDEGQKQWLATFEKEMSPEEHGRADAIVRDFRPMPSPLTLKGLSGIEAAQALVASVP